MMIEFHVTAVEAIRARDAPRARTALQNDILIAGDAILENHNRFADRTYERRTDDTSHQGTE